MPNPYDPPQSIEDDVVEYGGSSEKSLLFPSAALLLLTFLHLCNYFWAFVQLVSSLFAFGTLEDVFVALIFGLLHAGILLMIAIGAFRMRKDRSHPSARMAAELACIPMLTPFGVLGIPFGIWCLRVIKTPDAKEMPDAKED